jgi:guanine deaminase
MGTHPERGRASLYWRHGRALPTPNLFLGSGLFDLAGAQRAGVRLGVGTDVGERVLPRFART